MIWFIASYIGSFAFAKAQNKIITYFLRRSTFKLIKYFPSWHEENETLAKKLLEWVDAEYLKTTRRAAIMTSLERLRKHREVEREHRERVKNELLLARNMHHITQQQEKSTQPRSYQHHATRPRRDLSESDTAAARTGHRKKGYAKDGPTRG